MPQAAAAPEGAERTAVARWHQLAVLAGVIAVVVSGTAWLAQDTADRRAQASKSHDVVQSAGDVASAPDATTSGAVDRPPKRPAVEWAAASLVPAMPGSGSSHSTPRPDLGDLQVTWPASTGATEPPTPEERAVSVGSGDTLIGVLLDAGVDRQDANAAIAALGDVFNPRKLRAGQDLALTFGPGESAETTLIGLRFDTAPDRFVEVARADEGFQAQEVERELSAELRRADGTIDSSLYAAGYQQGLPPAVIVQLIKVYSFSLDFQRDIRAGDSFEVMYSDDIDEDGNVVRHSDIVYASLTVGGKTHSLWRYEPESGAVDYFDENGESVRRLLMRTPIDGARLSSGYGMRHHPILGYSRMHQGTDFAAPSGTPIYAAGNGTVTYAGRKGGYGNYVKIRHNGTYSTAYAHMKGFAKGIRNGTRVSQGQTIGYVGTTGRSTGPHLHYEVHQNGKQTNPMALEMPSGEKLEGTDLAQFREARTEMERQFAQLGKGKRLEVAATTNGPASCRKADETGKTAKKKDDADC